MPLITPFFHANNKKVLTGNAPTDPIQLLVDEYRAAATAKGYDYVGDYDALYEKYEELYNTNKLTGKSYVTGIKYAYKLNGSDVTDMLSLTKDNGVYNEVTSGAASPFIDGDFITFAKAGSGSTKSHLYELGFNQDSFYVELEGEMYYNSAIVYFFQPVSGINGSARTLINTSNRMYSITYNQDGTSSGNNTGNNYFQVDGSHIYRTEYIRTGDSCVVRVLRDGNLINTFNRTWNGIIDTIYSLTASQSVTMRLKRIEMLKL